MNMAANRYHCISSQAFELRLKPVTHEALPALMMQRQHAPSGDTAKALVHGIDDIIMAARILIALPAALADMDERLADGFPLHRRSFPLPDVFSLGRHTGWREVCAFRAWDNEFRGG